MSANVWYLLIHLCAFDWSSLFGFKILNNNRCAHSVPSTEMIEDDRWLVPSIPTGVSGTALAASLLRDGWSVSAVNTSIVIFHSMLLLEVFSLSNLEVNKTQIPFWQTEFDVLSNFSHFCSCNLLIWGIFIQFVKLVKIYTKYQEAVDALHHEQLGRRQSQAILERVYVAELSTAYALLILMLFIYINVMLITFLEFRAYHCTIWHEFTIPLLIFLGINISYEEFFCFGFSNWCDLVSPE